MVRNYKKKGRDKNYSEEDIEEAITEINAGEITLFGACKKYKIPHTTLLYRIKGIRKVKSKTDGRPTTIPPEAERQLAECLVTMEKWGFGLSRKEVLKLVGQYVRQNKLKTPFKNGTPGEDWFLNFKRCHTLSVKKPEGVEYARKKGLDPFTISHYFDLLESVIKENKLTGKPHCIYNLNETSFCTDPSKTKVVGLKNSPATRITSGPGKENKTVLLGANAAGEKLPPLIIFKGKNLWDEWMAPKEESFPHTSYAASQNGWMETDIFHNYITNIFLKHCSKERPILMLYDGHSTHVDLSIVKLAVENNIIILKLPPHTSHLHQPMDLAVFGSLKTSWDLNLVAWQRNHVGQKLKKKTFSILLGRIWKDIKEENILAGFKKAGVVPFDRNVIDKSKYDPESLKRWENKNETTPQLVQKTSGPQDGRPSDQHRNETNSLSSCSFEPPFDLVSGPQDGRPSTSDQHRTETNSLSSCSFEQLLLSTIKQEKPFAKRKKTKVALGAEVITSPTAIEEREKQEQEEKKKKLKNSETKPTGLKLPKKKNVTEESAKQKVNKIGKPNQKKPLGLQIKKERQFKKREAKLYYEDTESEDDPVSVSDSDDDIFTLHDLKSDMQEHDDYELWPAGDVKNKKTGDWVLVQLCSGKSGKKRHYIGQITDISDGITAIKYLRKKDHTSSSFIWPEIDDVEHFDSDEDILAVLPQPKPGRRGEIIFPVSFVSYNIQ